MPATASSPLAGPAAPRTCGRCRLAFAGDGDLAQGLETGWWACDACRGHLFGAGGQPADWRAAGTTT